ncbi:vitamin K-dependent protein S isoform X2 [Neoarius graeffei]|uniref:vitamin K-dependent protein S isoform X2 n=1 Tax=Neoarius graeffei TaxID=443677 RepID=UPI00298C7ECC|nr:vitamin K-dependent protein S isoform X2 [Neoarius graeffei]
MRRRRNAEWIGSMPGSALSLWLLLLLAAPCSAHRFLPQNTASQFLTRHRRANAMFEEGKKGNLERECIEELCSKEEAREIFENVPETEYFFPKYTECLVHFRVGSTSNTNTDSGIPQDLRTCVQELRNQCLPLPCSKEGYKHCIDGQGTYTCVCKPGWKGLLCEEDIDECKDPDFLAGCKQGCQNTLGSFQCFCFSGYYQYDTINCFDINECRLHPNQCQEPSRCVNSPGSYVCQCPTGYVYNFTNHKCEDIDECEQDKCGGVCVNTVGSYSCHCDGREGLKLAEDGHSCEKIPECLKLYDQKYGEILYLGEQFTGQPMIYLHFRFPENRRFAAEFDFRTFDPEGVILYAESLKDSWLMLGLRNGRIEVQFKNLHSVKVTSGGKAINNGQWHVISVEELENSISVKISQEAVMSINNPGNLFTPVNGKLEAKVYIAGLPNRTNNIIKQINPRLDGCIRGWNLMNQGASGVKEYIQGKESKHCFVYVEKGSYFSGAGKAQFNIDYNVDGQWRVDVVMSIRPSSSTGVLFALVSNDTVPLSVSVFTQEPNDAYLQVFLGNVPVVKLESLMLCYPGHLEVEIHVSDDDLQISANSSTVTYTETEALRQALAKLNATMQQPVLTYIGGLPDLPLSSVPVSAYYHGCMEIRVNNQLLDFDEAVSKHNSINSHSCPPVSLPESTSHQ